MTGNKTVVGLLDTRLEAQNVVDDLTRNGFNREDISMVTQGEKAEFAPEEKRGTESDRQVEGVAKGAGAGAAIGGVGGLLIGIAGFAIPGIGPIIAAGPIATALAGAGIGAVAGGLVGALTNLGVPEEEAHYYAEGVKRGGVLVTVATDDAGAEEAADIMRRHGAVDIDKRAEEWKSTGWSPYESQEPLTSEGRMESEGTIPVVEEDVKIGKRQAEAGRTRVHKETTEIPVEEEVRLREQRAKVERRPADRPLSASEEEEAFRETSFDIHETKEEPVVSKQARVKGEVVVGREELERSEKIREQARRTDVEVEHEGGLGREDRLLGPDDEDFRRHFRSNYARTGEEEDFQEFREAYAYGADKSRDFGYQAIDWAEIEDEIRREWELDHPGTWNMYKDAIHYGWEKEARHH